MKSGSQLQNWPLYQFPFPSKKRERQLQVWPLYNLPFPSLGRERETVAELAVILPTLSLFGERETVAELAVILPTLSLNEEREPVAEMPLVLPPGAMVVQVMKRDGHVLGVAVNEHQLRLLCPDLVRQLVKAEVTVEDPRRLQAPQVL